MPARGSGLVEWELASSAKDTTDEARLGLLFRVADEVQNLILFLSVIVVNLDCRFELLAIIDELVKVFDSVKANLVIHLLHLSAGDVFELWPRRPVKNGKASVIVC